MTLGGGGGDYLVQDFTSVSPFERITQTFYQQFLAWDVQSKLSGIKTQNTLKLKERLTCELATHTPITIRLSLTVLPHPHTPPIVTLFYPKASKYQRWFNLDKYLSLEVLEGPLSQELVNSIRVDTAITLLNATMLAWRMTGLDALPTLICREPYESDHHFGFCDSNSYHYFNSSAEKSTKKLIYETRSILDRLSDEKGSLSYQLRIIWKIDPHLVTVLMNFISKRHNKILLSTNYFPKLRIELRWIYVVEDWPTYGDLYRKALHFDPEIIRLIDCDQEQENLDSSDRPIRSMHCFLTSTFYFDQLNFSELSNRSLWDLDQDAMASHDVSIRLLEGESASTVTQKPTPLEVFTTNLNSVNLKENQAQEKLERRTTAVLKHAIDIKVGLNAWPLLINGSNEGDSITDDYCELTIGESSILRYMSHKFSKVSWPQWLSWLRTSIETVWPLSACREVMVSLTDPMNRLRRNESSDSVTSKLDLLGSVVLQRVLCGFIQLASQDQIDYHKLEIAKCAVLGLPFCIETEVIYLANLERAFSADSSDQSEQMYLRHRTLINAAMIVQLVFNAFNCDKTRTLTNERDTFVCVWKVFHGQKLDEHALRNFRDTASSHYLLAEERQDENIEDASSVMSTFEKKMEMLWDAASDRLDRLLEENNLKEGFSALDPDNHIHRAQLANFVTNSLLSDGLFETECALNYLEQTAGSEINQILANLLLKQIDKPMMRKISQEDPNLGRDMESNIMIKLKDMTSIREYEGLDRHFLNYLSLKSNLVELDPSSLREILYLGLKSSLNGQGLPEIVLKAPGDRLAIHNLINRIDNSFCMEPVHDSLDQSSIKEKEECHRHLPPPFLKEIIIESKGDKDDSLTRLYSSFHDGEVRMAWNIRE